VVLGWDTLLPYGWGAIRTRGGLGASGAARGTWNAKLARRAVSYSYLRLCRWSNGLDGLFFGAPGARGGLAGRTCACSFPQGSLIQPVGLGSASIEQRPGRAPRLASHQLRGARGEALLFGSHNCLRLARPRPRVRPVL